MAVERVRAASKEMLGNKYRVEIGAAMGPSSGHTSGHAPRGDEPSTPLLLAPGVGLEPTTH